MPVRFGFFIFSNRQAEADRVVFGKKEAKLAINESYQTSVVPE